MRYTQQDFGNRPLLTWSQSDTSLKYLTSKSKLVKFMSWEEPDRFIMLRVFHQGTPQETLYALSSSYSCPYLRCKDPSR
jgi:hypothetical protein